MSLKLQAQSLYCSRKVLTFWSRANMELLPQRSEISPDILGARSYERGSWRLRNGVPTRPTIGEYGHGRWNSEPQLGCEMVSTGGQRSTVHVSVMQNTCYLRRPPATQVSNPKAQCKPITNPMVHPKPTQQMRSFNRLPICAMSCQVHTRKGEALKFPELRAQRRALKSDLLFHQKDHRPSLLCWRP